LEDFPYMGRLPIYGKTSHIWKVSDKGCKHNKPTSSNLQLNPNTAGPPPPQPTQPSPIAFHCESREPLESTSPHKRVRVDCALASTSPHKLRKMPIYLPRQRGRFDICLGNLIH
jgi:hypothetical protein